MSDKQFVQMDKIAFYDMDKTITRSPSYNGFLLFIIWQRSKWRLILLPLMGLAVLGYALKVISREKLKEINLSLALGKARHEDIALLLQDHAQWVMQNNILPGALAQVEQDRRDGFLLVLATASYALYVEDMARALGFDAVIATDLAEGEHGHILPQIVGGNCYAANKLAKIKAWAKTQNIDLANCSDIRAYSDHISDVPMLELSARPVATNPHPPLRQYATEQGWHIVDWA